MRKLVLTAMSATVIALATGQTAQAHLVSHKGVATPGHMLIALRMRVAHDRSVVNKAQYWKPIGAGFQLLVDRSVDTKVREWHKQDLKKALHGLYYYQRQLGNISAWNCIHRYEGSWSAATGNGFYGGLQMDSQFQYTYGRDMIKAYGGMANLWHPYDQMIVAQRAYNSGRGYYPWPNTARMCGLI